MGRLDRPCIYLVEPNPFMAEMQQAILRVFEIRLVLPEELLSLVLACPPALVISEILLRGFDGLQLCRSLKENPSTHSVPVVLFSVLDAAQEAAEAGADAFLLKPAQRDSLTAVVRRLISWPTMPMSGEL